MKILMLTPYLPYPPSSGGQIRSFNLIKHLSRKHEITLFSLIKEDKEKKHIPEIKKYCQDVKVFYRPKHPWSLKNILRTGFGLYPFLVVRNFSLQQKQAVQQILSRKKYDLIHAETFYSMPHIPETKTPILLVDQTIEYKVYEHFVKNIRYWFFKPFLYIDVAKLKYWEKYFWRKASKVIVMCQDDKEKIQKEVQNIKINVVPNGVDLAFFADQKIKTKHPSIFFQGNFAWLQNDEAAKILVKKIYPLIKNEMPKVKCCIAGQSPKKEIRRLAEEEGVYLKELAPEDTEGVKKIYKNNDLLVAPLYGPGGTRLKILGAMAAKVPVVTTKIGGRGLGAENEKEILLRETPEEIAQAAVNLLKDEKYRERMARAAYKFVKVNYSWQKVAQKLDKIYHQTSNS